MLTPLDPTADAIERLKDPEFAAEWMKAQDEDVARKDAEIAKLKAELEEAQKIIEDLSPLAMNSLFLKTKSTMFAVNDERLTRARAFLKKAWK